MSTTGEEEIEHVEPADEGGQTSDQCAGPEIKKLKTDTAETLAMAKPGSKNDEDVLEINTPGTIALWSLPDPEATGQGPGPEAEDALAERGSPPECA
jgi:hypothetical protein